MMHERHTWDRHAEPLEPRERELDALVRPSLVVDPPADVQASILAAVLLAAAPPQPVPMPAVVASPQSTEAGRPVPLVAYLLLAGVIVAYLAGVSWLQGMSGNVTWLTILAQQLLAVSELVVGRPSTSEPLALVWSVFVRAPWLALLPVAWLLWERDRTSSPVA